MRCILLHLVILLLFMCALEVQCDDVKASSSDGGAKVSKPKKSKDRCPWNHIWNGTACIPGCEGWKYLEDGVCTPVIRKIGAWIQFGLCILGVGATLFLTPSEHAFLKPVFLSLIGFALLLNPTTWTCIGMLPDAGKWLLYAMLESVIVVCWTLLDLAIYYLLLWLPSDFVSIRGFDGRGLLTLLAKLALVSGLIWGRGVDFAANLPHLMPVYFTAAAAAPQIRAAFQDPRAPESIVTLRNALGGSTLGQIYFVYAAVACLFLLPMVRIVAHFLPSIVSIIVTTVEVITIPFCASSMKAYYQVMMDTPVQVPQNQPPKKGPAS